MIAYLKSLFTDRPQYIRNSWYYRRGKRISEKELFLEKHLRNVEKLKDRINNGPNIKA